MIKTCIYPHFFDHGGFVWSLNEAIFDKCFIEAYEGNNSLNGYLHSYNARMAKENEKFDLIMSRVLPIEKMNFLERVHEKTVLVGFETDWMWEITFYDSRKLRESLSIFDVICCWQEHYEVLACALGKQIWTFPHIFHQSPENMKNFDPGRKNLHLHGINKFQRHYYQTTFSFIKAYDVPVFYFTLPENEKSNWNEMNINWPSIQPHEESSGEKYNDFLDQNCRMMFQHSPLTTGGRSIIDAVLLGLPVVASDFWFQQVLFPDLIFYNLKEACQFLEWEYTKFEEYVEKAQANFAKYNVANEDTKREYNSYILDLVEEALKKK